MEGPSLWILGVIVLLVSCVANAILNIRSRGKKGWGEGGPFVIFCMLLFVGPIAIGYKAFGWIGAVAGLLLQLAGWPIAIKLIEKHVSPDQ